MEDVFSHCILSLKQLHPLSKTIASSLLSKTSSSRSNPKIQISFLSKCSEAACGGAMWCFLHSAPPYLKILRFPCCSSLGDGGCLGG
jgi:hypothetical protein